MPLEMGFEGQVTGPVNQYGREQGVFIYRLSLCSLGWPGHYVDQADLNLTETRLPLPPKCQSKCS